MTLAGGEERAYVPEDSRSMRLIVRKQTEETSGYRREEARSSLELERPEGEVAAFERARAVLSGLVAIGAASGLTIGLLGVPFASAVSHDLRDMLVWGAMACALCAVAGGLGAMLGGRRRRVPRSRVRVSDRLEVARDGGEFASVALLRDVRAINARAGGVELSLASGARVCVLDELSGDDAEQAVLALRAFVRC